MSDDCCKFHVHHGLSGDRRKDTAALFSLLRKGSIDIVFMLMLNKMIGVSGIAWATPFADWIAFLISLILLLQGSKVTSNLWNDN